MNDLNQLIHREQSALVAFAAGITRNLEEAEDVVQEVFVECLKRPVEVTRPYLFKAVRNRSLNAIRFRGRLRGFLDGFQQYLDVVLAPAMGGDTNEGLMEAILRLPPRQKEVVILRIRAELKISEIAEVLALPEGTIKSRLNSALKKLKEVMREDR